MDSKTRKDLVDAVNLIGKYCHEQSRKGGWWNSLDTGEPLERNRMEMLMLVTTEVAEAAEGVRKGVQDDHLPQYKMEDVEIADALIRLGDYWEGHGLQTAEAFVDKLEYNQNRADHKISNRIKLGGKKC